MSICCRLIGRLALGRLPGRSVCLNFLSEHLFIFSGISNLDIDWLDDPQNYTCQGEEIQARPSRSMCIQIQSVPYSGPDHLKRAITGKRARDMGHPVCCW